ncbi:MAG TPA: hypothetical protein VN893_02735 [Bryobacteraceae bacterium]|jgi:hypothetical protein|nr:hypothetical protein [Bryobacteraceae bacterium]
MGAPSAAWHARFAWTAFALALILYPALLWRYIDANAPIFDEGEHIAAGYRYWQCADYGINPEHPPLAKLIAAAPVHNWKIDGPVAVSARQVGLTVPIYGRYHEYVHPREGEVPWALWDGKK